MRASLRFSSFASRRTLPCGRSLSLLIAAKPSCFIHRNSLCTAAPPPTPHSSTIAPLKEEIDLNQVSKMDIRVATILEAHHVEGADKLLRLILSVGAIPNAPPSATGDPAKRTVFSGIKKAYSPEQLIGRQVLFLANLKPRKMRFGVSEGMILCASDVAGEKIFVTAVDGGAEDGMCIS